MRSDGLKLSLEQLRQTLAPLDEAARTDGQLLASFVATRDEIAFATLVRRHGRMVLGVCRRVLGHVQDAEDAFQATFLVLACKASSLRNREAVGNWLYGVAYRTSLEAKTRNARQRCRERPLNNVPSPESPAEEPRDWLPLLDKALNSLPKSCRTPLVLCYLEGYSRQEAARSLGVPEGTLSSRLARGRRLLAKRLAPYGLSLSGAALAGALCEGVASAQVPAALLSATTKAAMLVATGELTTVSTASAILMKGVLKSMFLTKLKLALGAVLVVTALGASGFVYQAAGQLTGSSETRSDDKTESELERLRRENELLKLNLEVVLEKVRTLEAEVRALKGKGQTTHAAIGSDGKKNVTPDIKTGKAVPGQTESKGGSAASAPVAKNAAVPFRLLRGHTGPVQNIRFASSGRLVSASGWPEGDRSVRVWDIATGKMLRRISTPIQVQGLDVSPDGRFALAGMDNGLLAYIDLETGEVLWSKMTQQGSTILWIQFTADGKHAFFTGYDGNARMWEVAQGTEKARFQVRNGEARGGALFPDGRRLLTADQRAVLQIWDIETGKEVKRINIPLDTVHRVNSLVLTPDGRQVVIGGMGGCSLFDLETGRPVRRFQVDRTQVQRVALSSDGKQLLTGDFDGVVRLWDFRRGDLVRELGRHDGLALSVAFSRDGRLAASGGGGQWLGDDRPFVAGSDHAIRLWDLTALTAAGRNGTR
ncbi:MAG TPA: sigma-70 family RNA polymerase sigma factor [Gemmataceae bacterium]|jgi:RNA polymerase sigma factor (sigma-70 family)